MSEKVARVLKAAQELTVEERHEFLELFRASFDGPGTTPFDEYWKAELARRSADLKSGRVQAVSGAEAKARIGKLLAGNG